MHSSYWRLLTAAAAALASGATAVRADVPPWQVGPPVENLQTQFEKFATDGKMPSVELLVKGTSSNEMFTAYSAGVNHVQGMAWYQKQQKWVIVHDTRDGYGKAMYVICSALSSDCSFHFIGKERHTSGAQIVGDVLVISVDDDTTYFVDLRDTKNPKQLPCTVDGEGKYETSGAVGMAWHPVIKRHVLTVGSGGGDNLFVSNGESLDSSICKFTPVQNSGGAYEKNHLHAPSEGLAQLYWDRSIKKLVAIGAANESGSQKLKFDAFDVVANGDAYKLSDHTSPDDRKFETLATNDYGPNFRWGGTSRMRSPTELDIIAAERVLTHGPLNNYMQTHVFRSTETSALSTYKVTIDCYHTQLKATDTNATIGVAFWAGSEMVNAVHRTGVSCSAISTDPTWEIETSRPITKVTVRTNGADAFYIDELRITKGTSQVSWQGRDDGSGWCVSTEATDAQTWAGHVADNTCKSEWAFSF